MFAAPDRFVTAYPNEEDRVAQLVALREGFASVDLIDDGVETAPSKRIQSVFPEYHKVQAGVLIALEIGLEQMCAESPHFEQWLERLRELR